MINRYMFFGVYYFLVFGDFIKMIFVGFGFWGTIGLDIDTLLMNLLNFWVIPLYHIRLFSRSFSFAW